MDGELERKAINKQQGLVTYTISKRILDIVGSLIGLTILSPVFLMISLFYFFGENRGPIFFKQKRIGKNGEVFYIYKFRSMIIDADKKLKSNPLLYEKYIQNNYKLNQSEDPRITKFGGFIRTTSLDELPQFYNILKGEMSLVGPRPVVREELKEYGDRAKKFLSIKPGITGYWQVSGRSGVNYPERCGLELYYIDHASFTLDIKILFKTILKVLKKEGAF